MAIVRLYPIIQTHPFISYCWLVYVYIYIIYIYLFIYPTNSYPLITYPWSLLSIFPYFRRPVAIIAGCSPMAPAVQALSKKEQILELFRTTEMKTSMDGPSMGSQTLAAVNGIGRWRTKKTNNTPFGSKYLLRKYLGYDLGG